MHTVISRVSSASKFGSLCIVVELNLALVDDEWRRIDIVVGRIGSCEVFSSGHFIFLLVMRLCLVVHWCLLS